MKNIKENLEKVTAKLPDGVRLVAVSKFHPVEELAEAYAAGQRLFGENRVWADAGEVDLTYTADTKLYIDNKLAALTALVLENTGN